MTERDKELIKFLYVERSPTPPPLHRGRGSGELEYQTRQG
jgi:hypothetical protein